MQFRSLKARRLAATSLGASFIAAAVSLLVGVDRASAQAPGFGESAAKPSASAKAPARAGQRGEPSKSSQPKLDPLRPSIQSMEITVVRSNEPGCEPNCAEWISADGTFDQKSPLRLRKVLARLGNRKLPLFINSPGGSVDDSIVMAGIIRAKGLDVVVARTDLQQCGPKDAACLALKAKGIRLGSPAGLARCASSCPFALAGGVRRMVGAGAYVGVHRAATYRIMTRVLRTYRVVPRYEWGVPVGNARKLVSEKPVSQTVKPVETSKDTYDRIEANFVGMGVSRDIMKPMLATPNTEMRWLSAAEIGEMRLVTERINGQQVVAQAHNADVSRKPTVVPATRTDHRTEALSPAVPPPIDAVRTPSLERPTDADLSGPFSFGVPIAISPALGR